MYAVHDPNTLPSTSRSKCSRDPHRTKSLTAHPSLLSHRSRLTVQPPRRTFSLLFSTETVVRRPFRDIAAAAATAAATNYHAFGYWLSVFSRRSKAHRIVPMPFTTVPKKYDTSLSLHTRERPRMSPHRNDHFSSPKQTGRKVGRNNWQLTTQL